MAQICRYEIDKLKKLNLRDFTLLKEWLNKRPTQDDRNLMEITQIIKQLLLALGYIHSKRIIHRDVKPDNIFVTINGDTQSEGRCISVTLGDFGLSKMVHGDKSKITTVRVGSTRCCN